jgi:hypothetical protein
MAIDVRPSTIATRDTGPLAADQFSMTIQTGVDPYGNPIIERMRAPGVNIEGYSPRFIQGYAWGRDCYYADVDEVVDAAGERREGFSLDEWEAGKVFSCRVRDIRPGALCQLVRDVIQDEQECYSDVAFIERVGCLVGYIATCVENFYGLACDGCGAPSDRCRCRK